MHTATKGVCGSVPLFEKPKPAAAAVTTTHYTILRIKSTASDLEIREAYKKCALDAHPDRPGGSTAAFKCVATAYDTLKDPLKRRDYDSELKRVKRLKMFKAPPPVENCLAPVSAKLCNDEMYAFETAPSRLRGRFRNNDSVRWPDGRSGIVIGMAGDGNLYWREDGGDFVSMFQPFGDGREVEIVYRMPTAAATVPAKKNNSNNNAGEDFFAADASSGPTAANQRRNSFASSSSSSFSQRRNSFSASSSASKAQQQHQNNKTAFEKAAAAEQNSKNQNDPSAASVNSGLSKALHRSLFELQKDETNLRDSLRIMLYQHLLSVHRRVRSLMVAELTELENSMMNATSNNRAYYSFNNTTTTTNSGSNNDEVDEKDNSKNINNNNESPRVSRSTPTQKNVSSNCSTAKVNRGGTSSFASPVGLSRRNSSSTLLGKNSTNNNNNNNTKTPANGFSNTTFASTFSNNNNNNNTFKRPASFGATRSSKLRTQAATTPRSSYKEREEEAKFNAVPDFSAPSDNLYSFLETTKTNLASHSVTPSRARNGNATPRRNFAANSEKQHDGQQQNKKEEMSQQHVDPAIWMTSLRREGSNMSTCSRLSNSVNRNNQNSNTNNVNTGRSLSPSNDGTNSSKSPPTEPSTTNNNNNNNIIHNSSFFGTPPLPPQQKSFRSVNMETTTMNNCETTATTKTTTTTRSTTPFASKRCAVVPTVNLSSSSKNDEDIENVDSYLQVRSSPEKSKKTTTSAMSPPLYTIGGAEDITSSVGTPLKKFHSENLVSAFCESVDIATNRSCTPPPTLLRKK